MTLPYLCILIAAVLPYIWVGIAKSGGPRYDNRDPRGWMAKQENPRVHRASAAQFNAFEAFAPFAASVLMAQFAGVDPQRITWLAIGFVVLRVLHGVAYVGNNPRLRSISWAAAFACVFALMVMSVLRLAA